YVADALQAARECRRTDAIARALFQLGSIAYASGQVAAGATHARQALDLFRRLGMKREQAEAEALLAKLSNE
ncbi:MAG: hypothetical protein H7Y32_02085, partial [Chloroflexales bacterium]|nr:hypothetical protein [Chloroflexales bacterium]